MKKLFLIICCLVGSTQSVRAMEYAVAALPVIGIGAACGGGIPFVIGLGSVITRFNEPSKPFFTQGLYHTMGGAACGGLSGALSYGIARFLLANNMTYAMMGSTFAGTCIGCGSLALWAISGLKGYR